ncbi:protein of unknown function [Cupriavidus taiwanensis]|uniref:Uncharacterized protein n=1 Tax=Cupriavidus taiwanensis TaxID=164546 RepID=A0A9Q7XPZ9_9BURK|nr:protein of unknown function [Cupriavidus taiwanensis]
MTCMESRIVQLGDHVSLSAVSPPTMVGPETSGLCRQMACRIFVNAGSRGLEIYSSRGYEETQQLDWPINLRSQIMPRKHVHIVSAGDRCRCGPTAGMAARRSGPLSTLSLPEPRRHSKGTWNY